MLPGLLGKKIGMTHLFNETGAMIPVTVIQFEPNYITQIKTDKNDGYSAVQVGTIEVSDKHLTFPKYGHLKKSGVNKNLRVLREFRVQQADGFQLGQSFNVQEIFEEGQDVVVTANSKGRGFTGGMKRHGFSGQNQTHGLMTHRRPLSNGATGPQRVFKGSRRPGRHGNTVVSQMGLNIVKIDAERNLLLVDGSVPGPNGGLIIINKVNK